MLDEPDTLEPEPALASLTGRRGDYDAGDRPPPGVCVRTETILVATPEEVWPAIAFYEEIEQAPSWVLRRLLPRPLRSQGRKDVPGSVVRCSYVGGYLLKRMTAVEPHRRLAFDVVEQALELPRGLRLLGGSVVVEPADGRLSRLAITTRYVRPRRRTGPLGQAIEARLAHAFHRHLLEAIRRRVAHEDSPRAEQNASAPVLSTPMSTKPASASKRSSRSWLTQAPKIPSRW